MKKHITFALLFAAALTAQAQQGGISGEMLNQIKQSYKATPADKAIRNALGGTSINTLALNQENRADFDTEFSHKVLSKGITDQLINNYRKIVRDQTFVDHTDNLYHLSMPQDSGFDSTEGAYDMKEIHRIVGLLPKEYRIPFAMHVSGFKYREIAEKLGLPLGTVKSRIFFTRQRLQGQLRDFV